VISLKEEQL